MSKYGRSFIVIMRDDNGPAIHTHIPSARAFGISDGILEIEECRANEIVKHRFNKDYLIYWSETEPGRVEYQGSASLKAVEEDVA